MKVLKTLSKKYITAAQKVDGFALESNPDVTFQVVINHSVRQPYSRDNEAYHETAQVAKVLEKEKEKFMASLEASLKPIGFVKAKIDRIL